jgi:hypothetical protein
MKRRWPVVAAAAVVGWLARNTVLLVRDAATRRRYRPPSPAEEMQLRQALDKYASDLDPERNRP